MKLARLLLVNAVILAIGLIGLEFGARMLEHPAVSTVPEVGPDPELGWVPSPDSEGTITTSEFVAQIQTNQLGLYGPPVDLSADRDRIRILALGDSFTAATGVSTNEAWPHVLAELLNDRDDRYTVYNGGVGAYSLDQYLGRMRALLPILEPNLVIIGFSTATDFYDVGRLREGNFVYGQNVGRVYFDLDDDGRLLERRELVGRVVDTAEGGTSFSLWFRGLLNQSALYRSLKRSEFAMWVAVRFSPHDQPLWPGLDTALKIEPSRDDQRRIALVTALVSRIVEEARLAGSDSALLHIPYLAQVYDSVWSASFGTMPERFSREGASEKLKQIADELQIAFIDTYPAFRDRGANTGQWLHHRFDGHPTVEGQELIARAVTEDVLSRRIPRHMASD